MSQRKAVVRGAALAFVSTTQTGSTYKAYLAADEAPSQYQSLRVNRSQPATG